MSETWVAPGWWLASDGKWYPPAPQLDPDALQPEAGATPEPQAQLSAVIDLRDDVLVLDLRETPSSALVPPPIPVVREPTVAPASPAPVASSGGRWGGHRVVANPVRSQATQ